MGQRWGETWVENAFFSFCTVSGSREEGAIQAYASASVDLQWKSAVPAVAQEAFLVLKRSVCVMLPTERVDGRHPPYEISECVREVGAFPVCCFV